MEMFDPAHPGEMLREYLPEGMTVKEAAKRLGVTRQDLSALLNGRATKVTPQSQAACGIGVRYSAILSAMKKSVIAVVVLSAISLPALAAEPASERPGKVSTEVGLAVSDITYKEPGVMREDGRMYGITGLITYPVGSYQLRADATLMAGVVDYQGSGTINSIHDRLFEIRGTVGRPFELTGWRTTPYIGLGYRYLFDGLGGKISSTGAAGYDRESRYYYVPAGAEFLRHSPLFEGGWKFSTTVEYDYFWKGRQYSNLGAIAGYEDVYNDQENGGGYRFSMRFSKALASGSTLGIEPYMKYWHIEDSKITTDRAGRSWKEPNNTSREWGIRVGLAF